MYIYIYKLYCVYLQRISFVVVTMNGDLLASQDLLQYAQHHRLVEGVRMVEIEQTLVRFHLLAGGQLAIETVLADANHLTSHRNWKQFDSVT